ncbi:RNA polymerase sigma factor [Solitalea koreensis]|uniref:RNA polymerase sigma-70 factor, ECF subfamily n=1 Tax=Solitalea koreensis TaxID=543615 RepID=A0A521DKK9_9SPHI|nr:RNA polymerase sigma-70 factor [Solitalea koreensis]SMO72264.1 RNA polymerase sigma-70 factor, ECF subfamily [Solitalea koreensis]
MALNHFVNELEILAQIAEGDQRAFTLLFKHYQRFVFSFGKKITHSEESAGEIVQDIFLKIWLARESLPEVKNFGAYLNRLVRNHSLNVVRKQLQDTKSAVEFSKIFSEVDESTILQLDYNETNNLLNQAIAELSPQQRMVYQLCHQQGLKYDEAAVQMNISSQTVNSYMKDALKKIRNHFRKHAVAYPLLILGLFDKHHF